MDKTKQQRVEAFYERKLGQRLRSLRFELQDFFGDFPGEYDRLKELVEDVRREEERKAGEMAFEEMAQKVKARGSKVSSLH